MKGISHSWELFEMVSILLITVKEIEEFQKKKEHSQHTINCSTEKNLPL